MIYFQLLQHERRRLVRSFVWRRHWGVTLFLTLLILYAVFALVMLGFLWREMVALAKPGVDPLRFLNRHLATAFIALFTLRFFVQRPPRLRMQRYLHLPIPRRRLVTFFQLQSLATIHNLFPFLFFVPLWMRHVRGGGYEVGEWLWLAGIVLLLLLSHYLNTLLRSLVSRSREGLFLVVGLLTIVSFADLASGPSVLNGVSAYVFDTLIQENPVLIVLLLLSFVGVVYASSTRLLRKDFIAGGESESCGRIVLWQIPFRDHRRRLSNLILLELKLMWRSERPKLYFLMSIVFGTLYVAVPLIDADLPGNTVVRALAALFASGIFAFNYGQLMFSWESSYFDGLLSRNLSLRDVVFSKLIILQGSCVLFFLFAVPLFLMMAPDLLTELVAFLFYNAGVSTVLILLLALHNRERVELKNVAFFDFEGFSLMHWLWYIPTVAPPAVLLWAYPQAQDTVLLIIGGTGLVSVLFMGAWVTLFTRGLERRRYAMAAGFRKLT